MMREGLVGGGEENDGGTGIRTVNVFSQADIPHVDMCLEIEIDV